MTLSLSPTSRSGSSSEVLEPVPVPAERHDCSAPGNKLAVVIPTFNDHATITEVVQRCLPHTDAVYVVNDGSTDATASALRPLPVIVVDHRTNQGKAASLVSGMKAAVGDGATCVVTIDADLQHRPEDIPAFAEAHRRNPAALVVGSRFERDGRVPLARLFANKFARFWISIACGQRVLDSQSGFRLYPRSILRAVQARHDRDNSFVFESEILIEAARAGFRIEFVRIDPIYLDRPARPSHYRAIMDTVRIFKMVATKIIAGPRRSSGPQRVNKAETGGN